MGPGLLEINDVPVPEIGPSELLIRVGAAGICHSDLHLLHFPYKMREEPLTIGHEIAGTIEAVGSGVDGRSVGERGVVYLCWSCGQCRECMSGNENMCLAAGRTAMPPCPPGLGLRAGWPSTSRSRLAPSYPSATSTSCRPHHSPMQR